MSTLLTDNLAIVVAAPNGIKKIRALILELAIRGKLVRQDSNDEPTSKLLNRINSEKSVLERTKKENPLSLTEIGGIPFEVPASWSWVRLGEVTNFGYCQKAGLIDNDTWVLDLEDIEKGTSRILQRIKFAERNSKSDKNMFQKGDVLYGKLRPYLNKVIVADENGICTTEIIPIRVFGNIEPNYLKIALKSSYFLNYVNSKSYGMKMPRLGTRDGQIGLIPLPPVGEQHRIVAKVDELMALCDRLEAQQADAETTHTLLVKSLLDTLIQSKDQADFATNWEQIKQNFDILFNTEVSIDALKQTLLHLAVRGKLVAQDPNDEPASKLIKRILDEKKFIKSVKTKAPKTFCQISEEEKPYDLPKNWEWTKLETLIESLIGGGTPSKNNPAYWGGEILWASVKDLGKSKYLTTTQDKITTEGLKKGSKLAKKGSVIVCTRMGLGKIAIADVDVAINQDLKSLQLTKHLDLDYFVNFYRTLNITGAGMTVAGIKQEELLSFLVPISPLAEQHRIVAKVDELMALCDHLKSSLNSSRTLQELVANTLIEQAVSGAENQASANSCSTELIVVR